ncbi:CREB-binding protein [Myotis brandtii]|uniref:histone acetyltransferase n=2 Tax=Myotis brandtii TaxID=109478 RepID=S7N1A6_MYOBR|nr:PREDICTED: CREB-binding protein isoform X2 [Myotis brandtii]EPQ10481.1 CREB-binding protein [Myotis brandtii]
MSVEMHSQGQDRCVLTCTECKQRVETGWFCYRCEDSDLCINCYNTKGHTHKMVKVGLGLDEEAEEGPESGNQRERRLSSLRESRRLSILLGIQRMVQIRRHFLRRIQSLEHACQCRDANCSRTLCRKMNLVVRHTKRCQHKTNGGCPVCLDLSLRCTYHAEHCQENACPVLFCLNIKRKQPEQRLRLRQQRIGNRLPQG